MKQELEMAIEVYSKAITRRLHAKARLSRAEAEDKASRYCLLQAKEDLRELERELSEGIVSPQLKLSSIKLTVEEQGSKIEVEDKETADMNY